MWQIYLQVGGLTPRQFSRQVSTPVNCRCKVVEVIESVALFFVSIGISTEEMIFFEFETFLISSAALSACTLFLNTHWRALIPLVDPVMSSIFARILRFLVEVLTFIILTCMRSLASHSYIFQYAISLAQLNLTSWKLGYAKSTLRIKRLIQFHSQVEIKKGQYLNCVLPRPNTS